MDLRRPPKTPKSSANFRYASRTAWPPRPWPIRSCWDRRPPAGTARGKTGDPFRAWREADGRITLENPGGRQTLKLQDVPFKNSRLILLALLKELPPDSPEAQKLHRALPVAEEEYGKAGLFTPVPTARTGTGQTAATPPAPSQTAP